MTAWTQGSDHPRVCGENRKEEQGRQTADGSPPRVRGKHSRGRPSSSGRRITPACAGKTPFSCKRHYSPPDHPRVCGENVPVIRAPRTHDGSPPRVRGKLITIEYEFRKGWITPACAGKTCHSRSGCSRDPDHPRVCGENTCTGAEPAASPADHPRVCGENYWLSALPHFAVGSPPRVRGKPDANPGRDTTARITPACAGKTWIRR